MSDLANKVKNAVSRLQLYEPPDGYYLAFSGGKDSCVIKALADMAGIKYDAHYNVTSVDPPELVQFIKEKHPDVSRDIPRDRDGKQIHMWNLIKKRGLPLRNRRFCCAELKESQTNGRVAITGVRWAESINRKMNQGNVTLIKIKGAPINSEYARENDRKGIVLTDDNDETRRIVEQCYQRGRVLVNPIVEWSDTDIWEFIRGERIPVCGLYECGYSRLGCIGCPMGKLTHRLVEFERYPKYKAAYRRAIQNWIDRKKNLGTWTNVFGYETVDDWWHWWLEDRPVNQIVMEGFDDDDDDTT